jgi:anthranilate 1,2-dioxygenase small subunit
MAEYAMAIDDNRLEDWVELFDEACDYKVVTRENVEQNLPNVLMWCDNKNMLRDRIESYRHVNLYNLHYDRHVLGPLKFVKQEGLTWTFDASYSLFQTEPEGASRLFSVGRYRVEALVEGGAARLKCVTVVADTGLIPSLLATPI